jgi:hypothetical protein
MPSPELRPYEGKLGVLSFADGHMVRARIVHVDPDDRHELVYDVVEVIAAGRSEWGGIAPGTVAAAPLEAVVAFEEAVDA